MPNWTNSPPEDPRGQGLPLIRTPANGTLAAIVTSEKLIGTDTHFWGGHTVPCERPDCDACAGGIAYRWHGYLTAYNPRDQLHFIFEMTAQAAIPFIEFAKKFGSLRTCAFYAYRWQHRRNGRVIIKVENSATPSNVLPHAPFIEKVMAIVWRLPANAVQESTLVSGRPSLHIDPSGNGQSSDLREYPQPGPLKPAG